MIRYTGGLQLVDSNSENDFYWPCLVLEHVDIEAAVLHRPIENAHIRVPPCYITKPELPCL